VLFGGVRCTAFICASASGGTVWLAGRVVEVVDGGGDVGCGPGFGGAGVGWGPGRGGFAVVGTGFAVVPGPWAVVGVVVGVGTICAPARQAAAPPSAATVLTTTAAARQRDLTPCRSPRLGSCPA
jgi:hypothetical protein